MLQNLKILQILSSWFCFINNMVLISPLYKKFLLYYLPWLCGCQDESSPGNSDTWVGSVDTASCKHKILCQLQQCCHLLSTGTCLEKGYIYLNSFIYNMLTLNMFSKLFETYNFLAFNVLCSWKCTIHNMLFKLINFTSYSALLYDHTIGFIKSTSLHTKT